MSRRHQWGQPGQRDKEDDEGQAAVELALVLPLVAVLLLAIVQVGLLAKDQVLLVHAAREAARSAAVGERRNAVRQAALEGSGLDSRRLALEIRALSGRSARVEARLRYRAPTGVVLLGGLMPDVVLHARAAMRRESGS